MKKDLEDEIAEKAEATKDPPSEMIIEPDRIRKSAFSGDAIMSAENIILDPSNFKWKVFLAGSSGAGKTMALTTLPGKKLLVDFDNRADTVAGLPGIDIYPCHEPEPKSPKAWDKAERLRKVIISEVRQGIFPYDSVLFDGLTMLGRMSLNWALTLDSKRGLGGSPAQQHYGPQMDNLAKYVLSTITLPIHVAWTGHIELIEEKETGRHRNLPKITGKLRTEVANWFNETYFCYRQPDDKGKLKYYWQTGGSGKNEFFKSSLNQLGKFWEDPILIDFEQEEVGFQDLFQRRFGLKTEEKGGE